MSADPVTGLVLAGGQSRRMGGRAKGLLPLRGRPMIAHVLERLVPQVDHVLINANGAQEDYGSFGHPVIGDITGGFAGPLAGLQAGLRACATPLLASVPCDAPYLPQDLVDRLRTALAESSASIAVAACGEFIQPTFMLCRTDVLDELERYLAGDGRRLQTWLAAMNAKQVTFPDERAFANVNTPDELDTLERASVAAQ